MAVKGIDVSEFAGTIQWDKVKADGIVFAMIGPDMAAAPRTWTRSLNATSMERWRQMSALEHIGSAMRIRPGDGQA